MASIRNHGKLDVRDPFEHLQSMLKADKIVITKNHKYRRFIEASSSFENPSHRISRALFHNRDQ